MLTPKSRMAIMVMNLEITKPLTFHQITSYIYRPHSPTALTASKGLNHQLRNNKLAMATGHPVYKYNAYCAMNT